MVSSKINESNEFWGLFTDVFSSSGLTVVDGLQDELKEFSGQHLGEWLVDSMHFHHQVLHVKQLLECESWMTLETNVVWPLGSCSNCKFSQNVSLDHFLRYQKDLHLENLGPDFS